MSRPDPHRVDLSEDDLSWLVDSGAVAGEDEHTELQRLSRSISGQYVEVIASFAREAFRGETTAGAHERLTSAISALQRLAAASEDQDLVAVLDDLERLAPGHRAVGGRARQRFMRRMRAWVLAFTELLGDSDARRLQELVSFEGKSLPLLDALAEVHGIGPRRLERLYCAGLFRVEVVSTADPLEVAQVTGLPLALAKSVVTAAHQFGIDQRRRACTDLAEAVAAFERQFSMIVDGHAQYDDMRLAGAGAVAVLEKTLAGSN